MTPTLPLQLDPLWYAGFASMAAAGLAGSLALAYAVFADAKARDSDHALFWGVVAVCSPAVVVYLFLRSRLPPRGPSTDRERLARTAAGALVLAFVVAAAFAPPDPFTQILWFWPSLLVAAPASYVVFYRQ